MKTSIGTEEKNAPNANNEIPPKVNITPPIIVRMAIIVTPIGLFVLPNCIVIYLSRAGIKGLKIWDYFC